MSFEIHNPQGKAIGMYELDKEACEFWKVKSNPVHYAHPPLDKHYTNDWFSSIGWAIHHPEGYVSKDESPWNDVKCTLWTIQARGLYKSLYHEDPLVMKAEIEAIEVFLKPYFDLINHWQSKGYIPIKIN